LDFTIASDTETPPAQLTGGCFGASLGFAVGLVEAEMVRRRAPLWFNIGRKNSCGGVGERPIRASKQKSARPV